MMHRLGCTTLIALAAALPLSAEDKAAADRPEMTMLLEAASDGQTAAPEFSGEHSEERERMVADQIRRRGVADRRVLDAMRALPRHAFIPPSRARSAYADQPLPIGHGQTISQPYIVAFMSEQLGVGPGDRVLEVGTGSGYQAAVLAAMGVEVVSIEIIEALAKSAAERLDRMGFDNITVIHGDGYYGYAEYAPYDAIIVTAAAEHVPPPLIGQLRPGRPMIIPVGRAGWTQNLLRVERREDGSTRSQNLMAVSFVPLTGDH